MARRLQDFFYLYRGLNEWGCIIPREKFDSTLLDDAKHYKSLIRVLLSQPPELTKDKIKVLRKFRAIKAYLNCCEQPFRGDVADRCGKRDSRVMVAPHLWI